MAPRIGKSLRQHLSMYGILLVLMLTSACANPGVSPASTDPSSLKPGDKFGDFFNQNGGRAVLGEIISDQIEVEGVTYQYTAKVKMVYDPSAPLVRRWSLAPLGLQFNLADSPSRDPSSSSDLYVNGHWVHPVFLTKAQAMGFELTGKPISEIHVDAVTKTTYQFFENVGFYHHEGDPPDQVFLVDLGRRACGSACSGGGGDGLDILFSVPLSSPFSEAYEQIGRTVLGFPIRPPDFGPDSSVEVICEYGVMRMEFSNPERVFLAPVVLQLGYLPGHLVEPSQEANFTFYEIENGLGYNILNPFLAFIQANGGFEISGAPIGEIEYPSLKVVRQCFENLCLDLNQQGVVRPVELGYPYAQLHYEPIVKAAPNPTPRISMSVWAQPDIPVDQPQEFVVVVKIDGQPAPNEQPVLYIKNAEGEQESHTFPPTRFDGQTRLRLPPLGVENSTLVPYQVCITSPSGSSFCHEGSYLIWNKP